jgi:hypothetical protein
VDLAVPAVGPQEQRVAVVGGAWAPVASVAAASAAAVVAVPSAVEVFVADVPRKSARTERGKSETAVEECYVSFYLQT